MPTRELEEGHTSLRISLYDTNQIRAAHQVLRDVSEHQLGTVAETIQLTFSSTNKLRHVEKPSNQNVSFRLMIVLRSPFFVHLSKLLVRRQNIADDQHIAQLNSRMTRLGR
jgi:hypothetical protein